MSELIVIIRPSFKKISGGDPCRAALLNHLLYWIAQKAKGQDKAAVQEGRVYWYGTAEEICAGLDHSWSINKVRKELRALIEAGLLGQTRNPVKGWDQTRHYFIGLAEGRAIKAACEKHGICLLHLGLRPDVLHLLYMVNAFDKSVKCSCQIGEMDTTDMGDEGDKNGDSTSQISEMELPHLAVPTTKNGNAIPKDIQRVSPKVTPKGFDKGGDPPLSGLDLWIKEKKIKRSQDKSVVAGQLLQLESEIKTRAQFDALYLIAKERLERVPDNDGKLNLGNLVSALGEWKVRQIPEPKPAPIAVDLGVLDAQIKQEYPMFFTQIYEALSVVVIWYGPTDNDYIEVRDSADWHLWRQDTALMEQAVHYGQSVRRSA